MILNLLFIAVKDSNRTFIWVIEMIQTIHIGDKFNIFKINESMWHL